MLIQILGENSSLYLETKSWLKIESFFLLHYYVATKIFLSHYEEVGFSTESSCTTIIPTESIKS